MGCFVSGILRWPGDSRGDLFMPYLEVTYPLNGSLNHPKKGTKDYQEWIVQRLGTVFFGCQGWVFLPEKSGLAAGLFHPPIATDHQRFQSLSVSWDRLQVLFSWVVATFLQSTLAQSFHLFSEERVPKASPFCFKHILPIFYGCNFGEMVHGHFPPMEF